MQASKSHLTWVLAVAFVAMALVVGAVVDAQEKSVRPGINDRFKNADVEKLIEQFERNGREIYDNRLAIRGVLQLKPGMDVADIGAGTGFFTMMFADVVGPKGMVYAVEIDQN